MLVNPKRVRALTKESQTNGPVIYWMSRDQRVGDNWALLYARELAEKYDTYLAVAFCIFPQFSGASRRQYLFLLRGLKEVENNLRAQDIPFFFLQGDPVKEVSHLLGEMDAGALVCDFSPIRQSREWRSDACRRE